MTQKPKLKPMYSPREHFMKMIDEAIEELVKADAKALKREIFFSANDRSQYKQIIDAAVVMAAYVDIDVWSEFNFRMRFSTTRMDLYEKTMWLRIHTTRIEEYFEDRGFNISDLDHLKFKLR